MIKFWKVRQTTTYSRQSVTQKRTLYDITTNLNGHSVTQNHIPIDKHQTATVKQRNK